MGTAAEEAARTPSPTPVPALPPIPNAMRRHKGKITLVSVLAAAGAIPLILKAAGLRLAPVDEAKAATAPHEPAGGEEGAPPVTPTRERVRLLEERAERVETAVVEMRDRVGSLATQQAVMVERSNALKDQVEKASSDNAARFDKIVDRLDAIRDAAARQGR